MHSKLIERIHDLLDQRFDRFPIGKCHQASEALRVFGGLETVSGVYVFPEDPSRTTPHHWNKDPSTGLYVDITQYQFQQEGRDIILKIITGMPRALPQLRADKNADPPGALPSHLRDYLETELRVARLI